MRPLGSSSKERSWLGVPFPYPSDDLVIWYSCILSSWTQWLQGLQGFWGIKLFSSRNCILFQKGLSSLLGYKKYNQPREGLVCYLCWPSALCLTSGRASVVLTHSTFLIFALLLSATGCYSPFLQATFFFSPHFFFNPFYFVLNFPTSSFCIATDKRWVILSFW